LVNIPPLKIQEEVNRYGQPRQRPKPERVRGLLVAIGKLNLSIEGIEN